MGGHDHHDVCGGDCDAYVDHQEGQPGASWVPAALVILMAYGVTMAALFPRIVRRRPDEVLATQLGMLLAVFVIGWVGALGGAGRWLPGLGFLLVAGGWLMCSRQARRTQRVE